MLVRAQISISSDRLVFGVGDAPTLARSLVDRGALALQLRDIDGAILRSGEPPAWLGEVLGMGVPVQLDAALVDSHEVERASNHGFDSVVVGMAALFEPMLLRWSLDLLGTRLVVELNMDGDYLFDPPAGGFDMELAEAVRQLHFHGVRHVLLRDITGVELPLSRLQHVCGNLQMGVAYSGPVRSIADLEELLMVDPVHFEAVVLGEPLYDGRIDIGQATRLAS